MVRDALVKSATIYDAARLLGVTIDQLVAFLNQPGVQSTLDREAQAIYREGIRSLQRSVAAAIALLSKSVEPSTTEANRPSRDQIEAAKTILAQTAKLSSQIALQSELDSIRKMIDDEPQDRD